VDRLVLAVSGLEDFVLPQCHRQRFLPRKDGLYLELSRDFRVTKPVPLAEEDRRKFLQATPTIQADHAEVRRTARKVVGTEKDTIKVAGLLVKWVYKNLRKSYSSNADNALTVLDNKAGDCTEHALLFVALARAAGLPARGVGGVAFVEGDKPLFGWHAWAEVYDGTQWVSVDPTWNQVYVDATHLKLSEGSQDFAWINVAGKLKLKVVEVKKRK
jgi:transglutaminase-like putative cysteine protease